MYTIGIDLGTTNSVACTMRNGSFEFIKFRNKDLLPSDILYQDGKITVGDMARRKSIVYAQNYVKSSKTFMGDLNKEWNLDGKIFTPTDIAREILFAIKKEAESFFGINEEIVAVITVPAYFTSNQIDETKKAGTEAGFFVKQIITEPIAAAVAYGFDDTQNEKIYIVDLGGGTFDVCLLEKNGSEFTSLVVDGDKKLGGDDFDNIILEIFHQTIRKELGIDLTSLEKSGLEQSEYSQVLQKLLLEAEKTKIEFTDSESVDVQIPNLINYNDKLYNFNLVVTRDKFDEESKNLIRKIERVISNSIDDNDYEIEDIDKVILVGGTSNILSIKNFVRNYFGKQPYADRDLSKLVAMGAALIANDEDSTITVKDIISHSLGIETVGNEFTKILEKNEIYPLKRSRIFSTTVDYQEEVSINVFEGEDIYDVENNEFYGSFILDGIEKEKAGVPEIEVTFTFDKNRTLLVEAKDLKTGSSRSQVIDIQKGLRREIKSAQYDMVILLDNSGSMSGDMETAKDACRELVSSMIDLSKNRIGLISFETISRIESYLSQNQCNLIAKINGIYASGGTNMTSALINAQEVLRDRKNSPVIILVTDGYPNSPAQVDLRASELKYNENVRIITIGVGSGVEDAFLKQIASSPDDYYYVSDMSQLKNAFNEITQGLQTK